MIPRDTQEPPVLAEGADSSSSNGGPSALAGVAPERSGQNIARCHACYNSFSGWWCDNCEQWPCICEVSDGR